MPSSHSHGQNISQNPEFCVNNKLSLGSKETMGRNSKELAKMKQFWIHVTIDRNSEKI